MVDVDESLNRRGKWKRRKCLEVFSALILLFMRQLELKIVFAIVRHSLAYFGFARVTEKRKKIGVVLKKTLLA